MTSEAQSKAHKGRPIMMIGAEESEQDCPAETTALLDAGPGQDEDATTQQSLGDLEDFQGLPWWRKPTVCAKMKQNVVSSDHAHRFSGVLANRALFSIHSCFWGLDCSQNRVVSRCVCRILRAARMLTRMTGL